MLRYDDLYKTRIREAGMNMMLYERYIDDSNQVAIVPTPGSKYDAENNKIFIDEDYIDIHENDEKRTAGNIMFQHYEKPTASGSIMHANTAQAISCRNSVHTQEIMRRLLNSSPLLDWKSCVAPVLSEYMLRMMQHGYPQQYRVDTLIRALRIYDHMVEEERKGIRPLFRPKDWNIPARRKEKEKKKYNWSTKGGHIAPIFVPPTPNGELANYLKVHFKIIETGGISLRSILQKSNPLKTLGCDNADCLPCKEGRGAGGDCEGGGVNYEIECQKCPGDKKSV